MSSNVSAHRSKGGRYTGNSTSFAPSRRLAPRPPAYEHPSRQNGGPPGECIHDGAPHRITPRPPSQLGHRHQSSSASASTSSSSGTGAAASGVSSSRVLSQQTSSNRTIRSSMSTSSGGEDITTGTNGDETKFNRHSWSRGPQQNSQTNAVLRYREPCVLRAPEASTTTQGGYLRGVGGSKTTYAALGDANATAVLAFHHPEKLMTSCYETSQMYVKATHNPLLCGKVSAATVSESPTECEGDEEAAGFGISGRQQDEGTYCSYHQPVCVYMNVDSGKYLSMDSKGVELKRPEDVRKSKKKREIQFYARPFQGTEEMVFARSDAKILLGDSILLESVRYPGVFISGEWENTCDDINNCVPLGKTTSEMSALIVRPHLAPLNILVKLRVGSGSSTSDNQPYNGRSGGSGDREVDQRAEDSYFEADVEDRVAVELMKRLPESLVQYIFTFRRAWLQTCRLVSKSWRNFAEERVTRISISSSFFGGVSTTRRRAMKPYQGFVSRCHYVKVLVLQGIDPLSEGAAEDLIECKSLRVLSVGVSCQLQNALKPLWCLPVEFALSLSFQGCSRLGDGFVQRVAETQPYLKTLNLATTLTTDFGLEMISDGCHDLESLNLYGCQGITIVGIERLLELPMLKTLNIRGTPLSKEEVEHLRNLAQQREITLLVGPKVGDTIY
eukprot:gb/GECG01007783.1/.p1 GENE.gb/GECG01007783.1/~~gb/GECG01007783.1/.p1  ORF type:complete len:672 (+),score=49.52 gb/GECG01007783.1/:1-2016(+)